MIGPISGPVTDLPEGKMPRRLKPSQMAAALFWMAIAVVAVSVLLWLSLSGVFQ
jgi:hypothetical protein